MRHKRYSRLIGVASVFTGLFGTGVIVLFFSPKVVLASIGLILFIGISAGAIATVAGLRVRIGLLVGIAISVLVALRLFELDTALNIVLVVALVVTVEVYFRKG